MGNKKLYYTMVQAGTGGNAESTAAGRLKGWFTCYQTGFVSPPSLGSKASLDYGQAPSREVQSIPNHTKGSLEQFAFSMLGLEILRNKSSDHKDIYKRRVVLTHYRFSAICLEERRGTPAASCTPGTGHILAEAYKAHLEPGARTSLDIRVHGTMLD